MGFLYPIYKKALGEKILSVFFHVTKHFNKTPKCIWRAPYICEYPKELGYHYT
jgi:hypothetical protein